MKYWNALRWRSWEVIYSDNMGGHYEPQDAYSERRWPTMRQRSNRLGVNVVDGGLVNRTAQLRFLVIVLELSILCSIVDTLPIYCFQDSSSSSERAG